MKSNPPGQRPTIMTGDWSLLPKSAAEARVSGSRYYFDGRQCRHGHVAPRRTQNNTCVACQQRMSRARFGRLWEKGRPAREAAASLRQAQSEALAPVRRAERREKTRQRHIQRVERAIKEMGNTEDGYAELARLDRARKNPERERERIRQRRARGLVGYRMLRLRTPPWLSEKERLAIDAMYPAPPGYHVDHIVPISHALLAGLHVPGNLQRVRSRVNIKKGNRFECTQQEAENYVAQGLAVWACDVDEKGHIEWSKYPRPMD
jgi:hypothetical protein